VFFSRVEKPSDGINSRLFLMNKKGGLKFKNSDSYFVSKPAGASGEGLGGRGLEAAVFEIIKFCPFVLAKRARIHDSKRELKINVDSFEKFASASPS
jgi:hypothetical protein